MKNTAKKIFIGIATIGALGSAPVIPDQAQWQSTVEYPVIDTASGQLEEGVYFANENETEFFYLGDGPYSWDGVVATSSRPTKLQEAQIVGYSQKSKFIGNRGEEIEVEIDKEELFKIQKENKKPTYTEFKSLFGVEEVMAAIAHDASSAVNVNNPVTSQTTAFTVGAGSDRFLYVWQLGDAAATTGINAPTYAGVTLPTKINTIRVGTDRAFEIYYIVAPTTGTNNVVITRPVSGLIVSGFVSYSGVDQTTPVPTNTSFTDTSADNSITGATITTTVNNSWAVYGGRETSGTTITAGSGLTIRVTNVGNGEHLGDSNGAITPAGSHTFNGTYSASVQEGAILFELAEAAAAVERRIIRTVTQ